MARRNIDGIDAGGAGSGYWLRIALAAVLLLLVAAAISLSNASEPGWSAPERPSTAATAPAATIAAPTS